MTNCSADSLVCRRSCSLTSVIAMTVFGVRDSWPSVWSAGVAEAPSPACQVKLSLPV